MFQMPTKPQNAWKVLKAGVQFWGAHWGQLLLVTAVALIFGALPAFFYPELHSLDHEITRKFIEEHILFVFIFAFIMFLIFAFIVDRVQSLMYDRKTTAIDSVWIAIKKLPILIVALFIYDVVVIAGLVFFVIPGIAFCIFLSLYFTLIITDNLGPISAFKESWQLVTDHWFHSFIVLFVMSLVLLVPIYVIELTTIHLWVIAHPAGYGKLYLGNQIIKMLSGMLFYGVFVSILLMLQHDLKLRKKLKGKDLG